MIMALPPLCGELMHVFGNNPPRKPGVVLV
jgi:hypothetical protein